MTKIQKSGILLVMVVSMTALMLVNNLPICSVAVAIETEISVVEKQGKKTLEDVETKPEFFRKVELSFITEEGQRPEEVIVYYGCSGSPEQEPRLLTKAILNEQGNYSINIPLFGYGQQILNFFYASTPDKRFGVVYWFQPQHTGNHVEIVLYRAPEVRATFFSGQTGQPLSNQTIDDFRLDCLTVPLHLPLNRTSFPLHTDQNGTASIEGIYLGGYYLFSGREIKPQKGENSINLGEIELNLEMDNKLVRRHAIDINVVDEQGNPVPNALVSATRIGERKADENGYIRLSIPAPENGSVTRSILRHFILAFNPDRTLARWMYCRQSENKIVVQLQPYVSVTGTIVDEVTQKPLENIQLRADDGFRYNITPKAVLRFFRSACDTVKTDTQGHFHFEKIISGKPYTINVCRIMNTEYGWLRFHDKDEFVEDSSLIKSKNICRFHVGEKESFDLGQITVSSDMLEISVDDRLWEAYLLQSKIRSLQLRLENAFQNALVHQRNVLFLRYKNETEHCVWIGNFFDGAGRIIYPTMYTTFDTYEFVTLHTPQNTPAPNSPAFRTLEKLAGHEISDWDHLVAICFSPDGKPLEICYENDVFQTEHSKWGIEHSTRAFTPHDFSQKKWNEFLIRNRSQEKSKHSGSKTPTTR